VAFSTASRFFAVSVSLVALLRLAVYNSTWFAAVGAPVTSVYVVLPTVTVAPAQSVATVPDTTTIPAEAVLPGRTFAEQLPACVPPA
jgi:hypothetical protein